MIIVMKPQATEEQIVAVEDTIKELGYTPHEIAGVERKVIGAVGDERGKDRLQAIESMSGVESVFPILKPYKLASREVKSSNTVCYVNDMTIGDKEITIIAGPCSVESKEQICTTAKLVKEAGANFLRGGAYKPRTSPYSFQGLAEEGLKLLQEAKDQTGLPIVTEVMNPREVDLVARYADVMQVGARNVQNFSLLKELGKVRKPVLLKRESMTGTSIILITSDAERTLNTYLGAARELTEEDITGNLILRGKYCHLEGYLWDSPQQAAAARRAISLCRIGGVKVSLDLSDLFVVERYGKEFWKLLKGGRVDVVFANEAEAKYFTGKDPKEAVTMLGKYCDYAAVKLGDRGSLIFTEGKLFEVPAFEITAVDTTGAGDMYAACTLYGITQNYSPEKIGELASYASAQVVAQQGAQLSQPLKLQRKAESLLS